ncbi:hypothetical protein SAY86_019322 [Trapa natans]|uniref:Uncharacterized protein n=1 Tax=Trapa natans TaxID=22666 RepID=A0AAN7LX66_TRANT|nr:hypothetical protein SAY86_019322 [Trapa natans]
MAAIMFPCVLEMLVLALSFPLAFVIPYCIRHLAQRLESYYKRNYKDYLEFVQGSLQGRARSSCWSGRTMDVLDRLKNHK